MSNEIEASQHIWRAHLPICREVRCDVLSEFRPIAERDRPAGPSVIPRVNPAIPERERDVELCQFGSVASREFVLETVEAPADFVIALAPVRGGVSTQLLDERVSGCSVTPHAGT